MSQATIRQSSAASGVSVIGAPGNYWKYSVEEGLDLTRDGNPANAFSFKGFDAHGKKTMPVKLDKTKTALVVVDATNFMLHPAKRVSEARKKALDVMTNEVIPACHKNGVQVIYLNWIMTPDELVNLPPSTIYGYSDIALAAGKPPSGPGFPLGALKDTDGTTIDGGDLYIEGSWNVELYGPLKDLYEESQGNKINPDVVLHKKWMYGSPQLDAFLQERGIKSLMFGGFNTEQCVWATMLEARSKRYDTIMLRDCCGTIDRKHAQETVEGHFEQFGGLILTGKELEEALQQVA